MAQGPQIEIEHRCERCSGSGQIGKAAVCEIAVSETSAPMLRPAAFEAPELR